MYREQDIMEERDNGIRRAIASYFELKLKHPQIISLLQKYWGIVEEEANEFYREEKNINFPCRELDHYLQVEGWDAEEIDGFMFRTVRVLKEHPEFRTASPEKLKKEVENLKIKPVAHGRVMKRDM